MLGNIDAMATVAVKDLAAAKSFYGGKLGLKENEAESETDVAVYRSGGASIVVYQSEFAGTNRATSVTWGAGNEFDDIVATLQRAGVPFEHYDFPGMRVEGDVHVADGFRAAWFTDPDGNILHINNM